MIVNQIIDIIKTYFMPMFVFTLYLIFPREQYLGEFLSESVCLVSVITFALYVRAPVLLISGIAFMVVTVVVSVNLEARITMLSHVALTYVLLQYINKESVGKVLIAAIIISIPILMASYFFYIFLWEYENHPPGLSFFSSKVGLLNMLMMTLFSLYYFYYSVGDKYKKIYLYVAMIVVLCSLFLTLSKQVFAAILISSAFLIPLLWIKNKRFDIFIYLSVVVISYVIFDQLLGEVFRSRIDQANLRPTGYSVVSGMSGTRMTLAALPVIPSLDVNGFDPHKTGMSECDQAENYPGCIINNVLCREEYLSEYINASSDYDDLVTRFFGDHNQLGKYLGTDAAKFRWLSDCSKQIVVSDTSDRFLIVRKGLSAAMGSRLKGAENPVNFKAINWYSRALEPYHGFHNFIFDFPYYYGIVYFLLFCFLLVLSIMYVIKSNMHYVALGTMLMAFVGLRLLSGGIYEMFYIILLVGIILYGQYMEPEP